MIAGVKKALELGLSRRTRENERRLTVVRPPGRVKETSVSENSDSDSVSSSTTQRRRGMVICFQRLCGRGAGVED